MNRPSPALRFVGTVIPVTVFLAGCSFYPTNKSVGVPFCAAAEGEVYELVVRQKDGTTPRTDIRTALGQRPGFRCALPLTGLDEPNVEADLIVWGSVETAKDGATATGNAGTPPPGTFRGFFTEVGAAGAPADQTVPARQ